MGFTGWHLDIPEQLPLRLFSDDVSRSALFHIDHNRACFLNRNFFHLCSRPRANDHENLKMDSTLYYASLQDESFRETMEANPGVNVLLSSILVTLQRLEHHFEEPNSHFSRSDSSEASESSTASPDSTRLYYDSIKRLPALKIQNPHGAGSGLPLTPPDTRTASPADPYARVVSELRNRFAFADSDDESDHDEAAYMRTSTNQESPQQRQFAQPKLDFTSTPESDLHDAHYYDESIYESQLLNSQLGPPSSEATAKSAIGMPVLAPADEIKYAQPFEATSPATSEPVHCVRRDTWETRRLSGLGRSISVRKDRLVTWTRARISQDSDSNRAISVFSIDKAQSWVNWVTDETASRIKSLLKSPRRFYDKMTVTRVFYP